ncbi:ATP-binding cassette domain-containing protein [Actinomyces sp. zg-332]|uniref:ABC transporter ATP-binding protein n=1 Tax=Actinomyces sp. zg-332 TaxID=2708340 RepID=UPI0014206350|nr:ATP-binding cassette domain-containing protein [Actinomyces sp. zg-332]QPK93992.1 ATP-binding cassette domain-containing protein [Actinomyces sp. zg-332]
MSVVEINDLNLVKNGNTILKNVNLSIQEKQNWIILGPNGAGKTSLVQIIAGRLFPTNGEVYILDEKLGTFPAEVLHQTVGFASSSLVEKFDRNSTPLEIVLTASYGKTAHWKEEYDQLDYERAKTLLGVFGIQDLQNRLFHSLSQGEMQKVLLARALMNDPEILVLDEPTSGLDIGTREDLLSGLQEIAFDKRGPSMIMVTHHLEQIPQGFTHIALMKDGEVKIAGEIEEILSGANISSIFERPIEVFELEGRYFAKGK